MNLEERIAIQSPEIAIYEQYLNAKLDAGQLENLIAPTTFTVTDEACLPLIRTCAFDDLARELQNNSSEKDYSGGVKVSMLLGFDQLTNLFCLEVSDNVTYGAAELEAILKNVNSKHPQRTGKKAERQLTDSSADDGSGIVMTRKKLKQFDGKYSFYGTEDNRIVQVITINKAKFFAQRRSLLPLFQTA